MQYLLDFVHDHVLEEQLYCVLPAHGAELAVLWRRNADPLHWEIRPTKSDAAPERVARAQLVHVLTERGADLGSFERQLRAVVEAQIVVAHQLLSDARHVLGTDTVDTALDNHRAFARELVEAVTRLTAPALTVLRGEGVRSHVRSGHLALVR